MIIMSVQMRTDSMIMSNDRPKGQRREKPIGPMIDPCGTPHDRGAVSDLTIPNIIMLVT